jgi:hypothetical protein
MNKKGMTTMDMCLLLMSLEAIECVCTYEKGKSNNFEKSDKSSNKGKKVWCTPMWVKMSNPSLGLFLYHFFTYNGLVMSRVHPQQHKQQTNTTTMVMELLAPPAAWI